MGVIANLLVNIGVKGDGQAEKSLKTVRTSLEDIKLSAVAVKAALIGTVYELQQMTAKSGDIGTSLSQFNALTGQSVVMLQKFQYAGRQAGASAEDVQSSIEGISQAASNMLTGKAPPEALNILAKYSGGFDPAKAFGPNRNPFYTFLKLQEAAKNLPPDIFANLISSFGVGRGTAAAMLQQAFNEKNLSAATPHIYSQRETQQLTRTKAAWTNLGEFIDRKIGEINAKHGLRLVEDLTKLTIEFTKLLDIALKIAEAMKFFQAITKSTTEVTDFSSSLLNGFTNLKEKGVITLFKEKGLSGLFSGFESDTGRSTKDIIVDDAPGLRFARFLMGHDIGNSHGIPYSPEYLNILKDKWGLNGQASAPYSLPASSSKTTNFSPTVNVYSGNDSPQETGRQVVGAMRPLIKGQIN